MITLNVYIKVLKLTNINLIESSVRLIFVYKYKLRF